MMTTDPLETEGLLTIMLSAALYLVILGVLFGLPILLVWALIAR